jgi:hypothetical membrane protein
MTDRRRRTRRWLPLAGLMATIIFVASFSIDGATRDGYDPMVAFVSLLLLGDGGWVQVVTFIVSGALLVVFARGLRETIAGAGGAAVAIGLAGVGLIVAGIFPPDPGQGYPPGAPAGIAAEYSWHAFVHVVGALLHFGGLPVACILMARRWFGSGEPRWAAYSLASGMVMLVLYAATSTSPGTAGLYPEAAGLLQRLSLLVGLAWVAALSIRFGPEQADDRADQDVAAPLESAGR